jgi:hypothetical protein
MTNRRHAAKSDKKDWSCRVSCFRNLLGDENFLKDFFCPAVLLAWLYP